MKALFRIAPIGVMLLTTGAISVVSAQSWVADPVNNELEASPAASVKVGIGTISPMAKLHVSSAGTDGNSHLVLTQTNSNEWSRLKFNAAGHEFIQSVGGPTSSTPNTFNIYHNDVGNILSVRNSGNVGINNSAAIAKFQVSNGSVLFDGTTGTTPVTGAGTRLMYVPARSGAFRSGIVTGPAWDNIGNASFAVGANTTASGYTSIAMGENASATGERSIAIGNFASATGERAIAIGGSVTAQSFHQFVCGAYNIAAGDATTWNAGDPLFVIGNGTSSGARSNAMTVLKSGFTAICTTITNGYTFYVNGNSFFNGTGTSAGGFIWSDARFKTNATSITGAVDKIMSLNGVTFDYRKAEFPDRNFPEGTQLGFIAQDVEKVVPEVVTTTNDGYKAVAYQNLTALLTEAVKEQQKTIIQLRTENAALQSRMREIETRLGIGSHPTGESDLK